MKITKDKHSGEHYLEGKNFLAHFINDWGQIFGKWNWVSFHFIHIYFEDDKMTGGYELEVVILGLGFRARYTYNPKILKALYAKARKSRKGLKK